MLEGPGDAERRADLLVERERLQVLGGGLVVVPLDHVERAARLQRVGARDEHPALDRELARTSDERPRLLEVELLNVRRAEALDRARLEVLPSGALRRFDD